MYKVISNFHDKYDLKKVYNIGDEFSSDDQERINDLIIRGLIEGDKKPSFDFLTKKEIMGLLEEKGIEYNSKANKEELIKLLGGD
jgi:hypothetical protein